MVTRRTLVALVAAAALSLPILATRPAVGPDQRAAALVPPLPTLPVPLPSLPLPSLPLPTLPPLPLPTVAPLPTVPPLLTNPPPLPTLPIPLVTPSPTAPVAANPSSAPPDGSGEPPSDAALPPIITSDPPAGGGGATGLRPEDPAIAPGGPVTTAPAAPGAFDWVVGPVVALGVSALLALLVLLAQLFGGAAFVPIVRRTLGELRLRRLAGDSSAPPPGADVPRG